MHENSGIQQEGVVPRNSDLRMRAEKILEKKLPDIGNLSTRQIKELIHQLQVHQIELQIQNENLKLAYDKLEQVTDQYADFYNNSPVGYVSSNTFGIVHRANNTIARILGTSVTELVNTNLGKWCKDKDAFYLHCRSLAKVGETLRGEIQMNSSSSSTLHLLVNSKLINGERLDGEQEIRSVITDATEKKRLEENLRRTERLESIGTLAGGIAHDFNNMLLGITGNISFALSGINEGELFDVLSDAQRSAKQARSLTQQLLTFAKGGAPVKKVADINQIIEESAKFASRGASAKCVFYFAPELWAAEVDEGQIGQVIGNLVINASQAMPNGGLIKIRTRNTEIGSETGLPLPAGKYITVLFQDNGVGISERHLPHIFDPYFTTKHKGSGLGLAITFSIIKQHGGHIAVNSELGRGTACSVYLPASTKAPVCPEKEKIAFHRGHGSILVMDDQEPVLAMLKRILKSMGYESALAVNGTQAISYYREAYQSGNRFNLVILDLTVPGGLGGVETMRELRRIDPDVRAVVSSGYSTDPIMASYQDYGFSGVAPKPYTVHKMAMLLNDILK